MGDGMKIALVVGGIAVVGIGVIMIANMNANRAQPQGFNSPMTGQPALQGDAAMLFAGLSGGGNFFSGLFTGIGNLNRPNQQQHAPPGYYGTVNYNPANPIGPGNSPAAFGTPHYGAT